MTGLVLGELLRELSLPKPISVNALRRDNHKSSAAYAAWMGVATAEIMADGPRRLLPPPVALDLIFPAGAYRGRQRVDTDNLAKCILDALVNMGILEDDNRHVVPVIVLRWGPGARTTVRIYQYAGEEF